ncbi:unnamed protein product [Calypogeia fissa]
MAMAGAIVAPSSTTGTRALFRDEAACSTSCRAPQCSLRFSPLVPHATIRCHRGTRASSESRLLCRSGLSFITSWHGRSHLGEIVRVLEGRHCSESSRKGVAGRVHASLFGVGAPEALVIGVVALIVFGPKGLAELARTLGKSLKAFQPTIRELQEVSREFKNTLEQEIGLDELRNPKPTDVPPTYQQAPPQQQPPQQNTNGSSEPRAYTADNYVGVTREQAKALVPEDLRREAEAKAWGSAAPPKAPAESETNGVVSDQEKSTNES